MIEVNLCTVCTICLEMFGFGLVLGVMMNDREKPNEPKPKKWNDILMREWRRGFHAGEKSMSKRMLRKLKDEELIELYYSENGKKL